MVSIIVPCYNQGIFLAESLGSILKQTYQDWECIIVNDGSTDQSEEIALDYCKNDNRFKYFRKENGGSASARNLGLKNAAGHYVQFLDADDYLYADKLALSVKSFELGTIDISIVVTDFKTFTMDIKEPQNAFCTLKQDYLKVESILFGWDNYFSIPIHCGLFKSELFNNLLFNEKLKAKEDWIMWILIFLKGPKGYFLEKPLVLYRHHENGKSKNPLIMNENVEKAYKYLINVLPVEFSKPFSNYIIDLTNASKSKLENELMAVKQNNIAILNSKSYRIGNRIVNILRKLTFRK